MGSHSPTSSLQRKPSLDVQGSTPWRPAHASTFTAACVNSRRIFRKKWTTSLQDILIGALREVISARRWIHDRTTVQVKDTNLSSSTPISHARPRLSEDSSSANGKSSGRGETIVPARRVSTARPGGASDTRSPVGLPGMSLPPVGATPTAASVGAVEVHRARELRWISAMSLTPSSHARKSKKTRKLLQEGVPASVRYQVWAHYDGQQSKAHRRAVCAAR
jgi:hypothetical protein